MCMNLKPNKHKRISFNTTATLLQAYIQALLSTAIFSRRLSFFTVCTKMHFQHTKSMALKHMLSIADKHL